MGAFSDLLAALGVKGARYSGQAPFVVLAGIIQRTAKASLNAVRLGLTSEGKKLEARLTGAQMKLLSAVFSATGDRTQAAWKTVMREMSTRNRIRS